MPQDYNDPAVRNFYKSNQASKMYKTDPKGALKVVSADARTAARVNAEEAERKRTRASMKNTVKVRKMSSGKRR